MTNVQIKCWPKISQWLSTQNCYGSEGFVWPNVMFPWTTFPPQGSGDGESTHLGFSATVQFHTCPRDGSVTQISVVSCRRPWSSHPLLPSIYFITRCCSWSNSMYILLSPKGNFLSRSKLMYLFVALDYPPPPPLSLPPLITHTHPACLYWLSASLWAAYSSVNFTAQHADLHSNGRLWIYIWKVSFSPSPFGRSPTT